MDQDEETTLTTDYVMFSFAHIAEYYMDRALVAANDKLSKFCYNCSKHYSAISE